MSRGYAAVLLIAFGGPGSREEIRPFLARVLKGVAVSSERLEEVARHYEAVGGRSPLVDITLRQAAALEQRLAQEGSPLRVYVGMRNSRPFIAEALKQMIDDGVGRALGVILSSFRTEASWERYVENVADARLAAGAAAPVIDYCNPWHDHPGFVETWVERIRAELSRVPAAEKSATPLVFTAHSVPLAMAAGSPYVEQFHAAARLIAERLPHPFWRAAYQSRSGRPGDPWLEPDVNQTIGELAADGWRRVIVAPIGFVSEHVEVLYDLDLEARATAERLGLAFLRAGCPNDHPEFVRMLADVIEQKLKTAEGRR